MKVLIVDDSKLIRQVVRMNLESLNILASDIHEAIDGMEALKIARGMGEVDLIVTDLQMPHMDGMEFVKRIRMIKGIQETRVVAISSALTKQSVDVLQRLGVNDFVKKPFDLDKFMVVIKPIVMEVRGLEPEEEFLSAQRSEFIQAFSHKTPEVHLRDGVLDLEFEKMRFSLALDNFIKYAVRENKS